ncbi:MAG: PRC-barrel domain-containing protein [Fimbriimonadaceae bacterium]
MNVSALIGKPVISMSDGEKVGTVKDVLIDPDKLCATGYLLGGPSGQGFLQFDKVKGVGEDAITIEGAQLIKWATVQRSKSTGREARELMKLTAVDGAGTALGALQDLRLDMKSGRVVSVQVGGGGLFGIGGHSVDIPASAVRAVGPSLVTIEAAAVAERMG